MNHPNIPPPNSKKNLQSVTQSLQIAHHPPQNDKTLTKQLLSLQNLQRTNLCPLLQPNPTANQLSSPLQEHFRQRTVRHAARTSQSTSRIKASHIPERHIQ